MTSRNHPSATTNEDIITRHIATEVLAGRMVGPLDESVSAQVHTSPMGLVPKPHQAGKWRLIVDLSSPRLQSVNASISKEFASITYARVDEAVSTILYLGRGALLAKLDLKNAYRIVPVHPNDQHLLGVTWKGHTYIDRALPFGLRSAPKIFSAVADMVAWALHQAGIQDLRMTSCS